jgi:hypothetical protein
MEYQTPCIANTVALLLSVRQTTKEGPWYHYLRRTENEPFVVVLTGNALVVDCFDHFIGEFCSYFQFLSECHRLLSRRTEGT